MLEAIIQYDDIGAKFRGCQAGVLDAIEALEMRYAGQIARKNQSLVVEKSLSGGRIQAGFVPTAQEAHFEILT